MGNTVDFKRPDGKTCSGYLATGKTDASAPGFVVIQEWWGVNSQIKKMADRIAGAAQYLKQSSKKVAVGGFCMGGALTILCATRVPEMDAGACFYGIPPADLISPQNIKAPMIYHFANPDDWCTPAKVNELETSLKQAKAKFEFYRYDAHHAFMNEARPEVYDAASAKSAWDRTLRFLVEAFA